MYIFYKLRVGVILKIADRHNHCLPFSEVHQLCCRV